MSAIEPKSDLMMIDINGTNVLVGDTIRVLKLPDVKFSESEMSEVETMIGKQFVIESIEHDCAEVTQWFGLGSDNPWCHSLFLFSNEFELIKKDE